jgi:hypothetical protein
MLRYFYGNDADYRDCFEGLAILDAGERYLSKLGQHPVMYLSLKEVRGRSWEDSYEKLLDGATDMLQTHHYLLDWEGLTVPERRLFEGIVDRSLPPVRVSGVLTILSHALHRYHGQKAVILIDEYDAPIVAAYLGGYYAEAIDFLRDFLGGGFKDNVHLEKGVLTGIMRVAKESIFSGLNNLDSFTVLTQPLAPHFGFTVPEVEHMLQDFGMNGRELADVHRWYNGYDIAGEVLFNPWSIIQFLDKPQQGFRSYWAETSTNNLLKQLFFGRGANIEDQLETLIRGESLRKVISDSLIYPELAHKEDAIWSLLLSAGYLKARDPEKNDPEGLEISYALSIPNLEIKSVYYDKIRDWVQEVGSSDRVKQLLTAVREADSYEFEEALGHFSLQIFSYHDVKQPRPERFYHAFILGLLVNLGGEYEVLSNRESGYGRYDIRLRPFDPSRTAIVMELKSPRVRRGETVEDAVAAALKQLRAKRYATNLLGLGYQVAQWAIGVYGKDLLVEELDGASNTG